MPDAPSSPRLGWWLTAIVLGMVAMQFVSGRLQPEKQRPGTERNDLVLSENHLPAKIGGWTRQSFEPAKPPKQLPEGQYWWTHAWTYQNSKCSSIVAFDQLGLHEWHELTVCYQAKGWRIDSRTIESESHSGSSWDYVVTQMSNPAGESALVVFSVFWGNGQPMNAPHDPAVINFTGREEDRDKGIWSRMTNRITEPQISSNVQVGLENRGLLGLENRGLQCQVFLVSAKPLDQEWISDGIQLHLTTRQKFQEAWLLHAKSKVAN